MEDSKYINKEFKEEQNIKKGIYIPCLECKSLYNRDYTVEEKNLDWLLKSKIDFSHELLFNQELINNIEIYERNGKYYTTDIINIKFDKKYKVKKDDTKQKDINVKQLRDWSYENGVTVDGQHLVNWKRSSGKARIGQCLFIKEDIQEKCLDWARMGLKFEGDKTDIAGIRAYESLPLSSIIGSITIDPSSILVIDDYESVFDWEMSKTYIENGIVQTKTDTQEEHNKIWDGQCLLDNSIFNDKNNKCINGHYMALLRNRLFKSCAFNTNISLFFKDYCAENHFDYNTFTVRDIANNDILVKDIKMITTPSSLKIKKLYEQATNIKATDVKNQWLNFYLENCGSDFSVCKTEHASYLCKDDKHYNRTSYQMLNSLPFAKAEFEELTINEIEHVNKLKNDNDYFLENAKIKQCVSEEEEELSEDDKEIEEVINKNVDVIDVFTQLYFKNKKFGETRVFKKFKEHYIEAYVKMLRQGKIKIKGDYCTVCSNPVEMLYATVGQFKGDTITLKDNEIYTPMFGNDEELTAFRNPFVCIGNVFNCKNVENDMIKKYMNTNDNIVIINSIKYPTLTINSGMDMDSDTMLITNNNIVTNVAHRLDYNNTQIPVNCVEETGDNRQALNNINMASVDYEVSQNYIGDVINVSQILNSNYNNIVNTTNKDMIDTHKLQSIYNNISRCSSFSCVEIDKAKKTFDNLDVNKELNNIKNKYTKKVWEIGLTDEEMEEKILELEAKKSDRHKVKSIVNSIKSKIKTRQNKITKIKNDNKIKDEIKNSIIKTKQSEIEKLSKELTKHEIELNGIEIETLDTRCVQPYFFQFVGDNKTIKQRVKAKANKLKDCYRELCIAKDLDVEEFNKNYSTDYVKKIFTKKEIENVKSEVEQYINLQYVKMETSMDWLQDILNTISTKDTTSTLEVIELIRENKHSSQDVKDDIDTIIKVIQECSERMSNYRANKEDNYAERQLKVEYAKINTIIELKKIKISKLKIYKACCELLNKVSIVVDKKTHRKNKKVKRSGCESITLELFVKCYSKTFISMFLD